MIDDLHKRFIKILEQGCDGCDVDPVDGQIDHCVYCQSRITDWAYELFVIRMECPQLYDEPTVPGPVPTPLNQGAK